MRLCRSRPSTSRRFLALHRARSLLVRRRTLSARPRRNRKARHSAASTCRVKRADGGTGRTGATQARERCGPRARPFVRAVDPRRPSGPAAVLPRFKAGYTTASAGASPTDSETPCNLVEQRGDLRQLNASALLEAPIEDWWRDRGATMLVLLPCSRSGSKTALLAAHRPAWVPWRIGYSPLIHQVKWYTNRGRDAHC